MKVVLDTNVLISGIYFSGLPGKILTAWRMPGSRRIKHLDSGLGFGFLRRPTAYIRVGVRRNDGLIRAPLAA